MPYSGNSDLPAAVKRLPSHAQTVFRKAFNSAWDAYDSKKHSGTREQYAFRVAWAAAKKSLKGGNKNSMKDDADKDIGDIDVEGNDEDDLLEDTENEDDLDVDDESDADGDDEREDKREDKDVELAGKAGIGSRKQETPSLRRIIRLSDKFDPKGMLQLQLLRKAKLSHPWFGDLVFDEKMFDNLIHNFEKKITGVEIALDAHHRPDLGALGWLKKLEKSNDNRKLFGYFSTTPRGEQLIRDQEFKYASVEYHPDLPDRKNPEKTHGPTLMGIAATNRPFITHMKSATFMSRSIFDALNSEYGEEIFEDEEDEDESEALELTADEAAVLKAQMDELRGKSDEKDRRIAALEHDIKLAEVSAATDRAIARGADMGTVVYVKQILMSVPRSDDFAITLEDGSKPISLYSALRDLLTKLPAIVPLGERTTSNTEDPIKPSGGKDWAEEDVNKFAAHVVVKENGRGK